MFYAPQDRGLPGKLEPVSPVSPAHPDAELDLLPARLSKEELIQNMDRVDREITMVEQQISKLKKKQVRGCDLEGSMRPRFCVLPCVLPYAPCCPCISTEGEWQRQCHQDVLCPCSMLWHGAVAAVPAVWVWYLQDEGALGTQLVGSFACQSASKRKKSVLGDLPVVMQAVSGRAGNAA